MNLPCMNCGAEVTPEDALFFLGVYVCPTCHKVATKFRDDSLRELRNMQVMLEEAIRIALVEGKLHFGTAAAEDRPPSKREALQAIVSLLDKKDQKERPPTMGHPAVTPGYKPMVPAGIQPAPPKKKKS